MFNIVKDRDTGETEQLQVNAVDEATGSILNDLTVGEYDVIVTSQPTREAFEDSQFDQAVQLRTEVGIQIPDSTSSRTAAWSTAAS